MKKNFLYFSILLVIFLSPGCSSVSLEEQRVQATAFVTDRNDQAEQAASQAAMALCNVDISAGMDAYQQQVCSVATQTGCQIISSQIASVWQNFETSYQVPQLTCELATNKFLEETHQFGLDVQFWLVKLEGEGYAPSSSNQREYWLQVANEDGEWKLNRILLVDEIRYYLASGSSTSAS